LAATDAVQVAWHAALQLLDETKISNTSQTIAAQSLSMSQHTNCCANRSLQGYIADCSFVASMANIAEHPEFVNRHCATQHFLILDMFTLQPLPLQLSPLFLNIF
jgi:hypothetical protein